MQTLGIELNAFQRRLPPNPIYWQPLPLIFVGSRREGCEKIRSQSILNDILLSECVDGSVIQSRSLERRRYRGKRSRTAHEGYPSAAAIHEDE
jgi:hypothetical protein